MKPKGKLTAMQAGTTLTNFLPRETLLNYTLNKTLSFLVISKSTRFCKSKIYYMLI